MEGDRRPFVKWMGRLIPPLGHRAWWLLAGYTLYNVGGGLISPFLVVYLSDLRRIGLVETGLVLSVVSISGTIAVPVAGAVTDRLGSGRTVVLSLMVAAMGTAGYWFVHDLRTAMIAAVLAGVGNAAMWNGFATMLAEAVPRSGRSGVFGVSFGLQNLGTGIGAVAGGLLADLRSPESFFLLFLANALGSILFAATIVKTERRVHTPQAAESSERSEGALPVSGDSRAAGFRVALSDRGLLGAAVLNALAAFMSGALVSTAFTVWATREAQSTTRVIGLAFLAHTLVIVLSQLVVLHFMKGRQRTHSAAAAILIFGLASVLTFLAGSAAPGALVSLTLILSLGVFGLGETILQPSLYAWVNDLAPESLRGRYNAVFNLSWQAGAIAGPPLAGIALQRGIGGTLFLGLALVSILGALLAIWMARFVPATANLEQVQPHGRS